MHEEQTIRFSGVGAHFQNAVAERGVKTVIEKARTMLVHAAMHWPEEFRLDLWPYAIDYACHIYNNTPSDRRDEKAPIEVLCGVQLGCKDLSRAKVWGCPAYVLDPSLQDGKKTRNEHVWECS